MAKSQTLKKLKVRKAHKTHGFLSRMKTVGGRAVILARRRKGRNKLTTL
ncbi:MAG: 50S ribosomal protein L34 [Candidatus Pacebacteria bacterium]|nr:50S ribosomal protein L34 [Candidatus Paceibacterota bacterium]